MQVTEYAALVNTLTNLQSGKGYWIYASQAAVPYIGIFSQSAPQTTTTVSPQQPPAVLFGPVNGVSEGTRVQGWVGNQLCGEGVVQPWNGGLTYRLLVNADMGDGCGTTGQIMRIMFSTPFAASVQLTWDNTQAIYLPLTSSSMIYLPFLNR